MKFPILPLAVAALVITAGCDTAAQLNSVRIGMTKDQIIALLGKPDSTSAQGNVEYMTYYMVADNGAGSNQPYMVRLVDGRVESFGRFAQLEDLQYRPVNGQPGVVPYPAAAPAPNPDLVSELERLKALKDQGVLTDAEFQQAKAKLLGTGAGP